MYTKCQMEGLDGRLMKYWQPVAKMVHVVLLHCSNLSQIVAILTQP